MLRGVHTVLETPVFQADCKAAGATEAELRMIVDAIAANPLAGDLIPGTGGARKMRFARQGGGKGGGKSGGCRAVHHFGGEDVPVFLLALVAKSQRADLSQTERNRLRDILPKLAIDVRAVRKKTGLSQAEFARRFGFSVGTLRNWEQGIRTPQGPARALLLVIDAEPEAVLRALHKAA